MKKLIKYIFRKLFFACVPELKELKESTNQSMSDLNGAISFIVKGMIEKPIKCPTDQILVSIIMPTYNRGFVIKEAIDSILKQTHANWELIIVDDGSTDRTHASLYPYLVKYDRIKYFPRPKEGISSSRNFGLSQSLGQYITYLDSDNEWTPHYLKDSILNLLNNPFKNCGYSGMIKNDSELFVKSFNYDSLKENNFIDLNTFIHHRSLYESRGGFDLNLTRLVDWDLILKYTKDNPPLEMYFVGTKYYEGNWKRVSTTEDYEKNRDTILEKISLLG